MSSAITSVGRYYRSTTCRQLLDSLYLKVSTLWHWLIQDNWSTKVPCSIRLSTYTPCCVGARPELNTEIVIGETDYNSYAVIYYQKRGKITVKLYGGPPVHVTYVWDLQLTVSGLNKTHFECVFVLCAGRSVDNLSEPMLSKFERLAEKQNMGLAYLFPFPTYSMSRNPPEK